MASLVTFMLGNSDKSLCKYIAVESPSKVGFVAMIISFIVSVFARFKSEAIFNCSGPIPSRGAITPPKTWKTPEKVPDESIVLTS